MADSRRRVLHLIDTGGPGGAETIFLQLVTGLRDMDGIRCPSCPWKTGWRRRSAGKSSHHADCPHGAPSTLGYAAAIRRVAREEGVSLIQTHLLGTAVYGTIASLETGLPVVSTFHGVADIRGNPGS